MACSLQVRLFLLRESPQNFPRGETNRKRVAALRTEGKYSTKQSVKRAPRALFPRPDWMKGVQPSWASFLSPSISQQLDQPIFQQEFDVWTLGVHQLTTFPTGHTLRASSSFSECSRNGKYSAGIISSRSNGTEADKVEVFGFRGLVYMNLFSGSVDALRSCGNSGFASLSWIMDQRTVRFQIMWLLVCSVIAVLSGEHYPTQAQVMSSKALRAANTRSNGEFCDSRSIRNESANQKASVIWAQMSF